jgi:hypothetical protein
VKLKLKHQHGNVWMSDNGHRAFLRGERPACMLPPDYASHCEPTIPHHIQRLRHTIIKNNYSWELVMFYRQKP